MPPCQSGPSTKGEPPADLYSRSVSAHRPKLLRIQEAIRRAENQQRRHKEWDGRSRSAGGSLRAPRKDRLRTSGTVRSPADTPDRLPASPCCPAIPAMGQPSALRPVRSQESGGDPNESRAVAAVRSFPGSREKLASSDSDPPQPAAACPPDANRRASSRLPPALLLPYDPAIGRPSSMPLLQPSSLPATQNRSSLPYHLVALGPGSSAFDCRKATVLSRFEKTGNSGSAMRFLSDATADARNRSGSPRNPISHWPQISLFVFAVILGQEIDRLLGAEEAQIARRLLSRR